MEPKDIVRHITETMSPTVRDIGPHWDSDAREVELVYMIDPKTFPQDLWGTDIWWYALSEDGTELTTVDLD